MTIVTLDGQSWQNDSPQMKRIFFFIILLDHFYNFA